MGAGGAWGVGVGEVWVGGGGGWGLGVAGCVRYGGGGWGVGVEQGPEKWDQEAMGPGAMGPVAGCVGVGSVERVGCVGVGVGGGGGAMMPGARGP